MGEKKKLHQRFPSKKNFTGLKYTMVIRREASFDSLCVKKLLLECHKIVPNRRLQDIDLQKNSLTAF